MWQLEYSDEAKFYFIDNDPYSFDLLIRIEELKYFADAVPPEGCTLLEGNLYLWEVAAHYVLFEKLSADDRLLIAVVKPLA